MSKQKKELFNKTDFFKDLEKIKTLIDNIFIQQSLIVKENGPFLGAEGIKYTNRLDSGLISVYLEDIINKIPEVKTKLETHIEALKEIRKELKEKRIKKIESINKEYLQEITGGIKNKSKEKRGE